MLALASVPAGHPYVQAVVDPNSVALLDDPTPAEVTVPGQWWPPRWLEPDFLSANLAGVDVLHLHFGMDTVRPETLDRVADVLSDNGIAFVVTVHDIDNPHFRDQHAHHERLGAVLARADAVLTLTPGAAAEIERRWQRAAIVQPHPHVLPAERIGGVRRPTDRPLVAVHAKGLRANIDPWPVLDTLLADGSHRLRLDVDAGTPHAGRGAGLPERLARYRDAGVDVRVHPVFSDAQLADYLYTVDVLVLPYRFGTHSGWVEACHDARVAAVVPDCGYFAEQNDCDSFGFGTDRFDPAGLVSAVHSAARRVRERPPNADPALAARRSAQRRAVRAETTALYRRVRDAAVAA